MLFPLMTVALLFHKFHIYTILKPFNSLETTLQLKKGTNIPLLLKKISNKKIFNITFCTEEPPILTVENQI